MVSEELWRWFHRRWREIDQEWQGCPAIVVRAARERLRADVREFLERYPHAYGSYLIPV